MTGNEHLKIGGLLLAAGGSSRLGRPKQLVVFEGKTLLRRAAETLVDSPCNPVVVVLGAEINQSRIQIEDIPVAVCINSQWRTGMSSSIKAGLRAIVDLEPNLAAIVITLCDQPYISTDDIDRLTTEFRQSNTAIVAAAYENTIGVPALFSRESFNELLHLEGDTGARHLLRNRKNVIAVKMHNATFDIDTTDDLREFSK